MIISRSNGSGKKSKKSIFRVDDRRPLTDNLRLPTSGL
jgi:hypothetical protein